MEGSVDDLGAPESWEVADLDESMSRLMLSSHKDKDSKAQEELDDGSAPVLLAPHPASSSVASGNFPEDVIDQVDQFLREALQNPRERLSVLRMEQDLERFIRDPSQEQFEFQPLPTSYLRLAAHRVAQHYSLQSMVLLDSNSLDGSGSRIVARKTCESRLPTIRLADIPVSLPSEERSPVKVFIKQRPQRHLQHVSSGNVKSLKSSSSKSVEERKEEYNRANTEFPQLQSAHQPQISAEHQPSPLHQQLSGLWPAPSGTAGIGYGHPESLMTPYSPAPVGTRSAPGAHLQSPQYSGQRPGMPYSYPHEHVHSIFSQQADTSSELARPW